jgi:hypothetical protein
MWDQIKSWWDYWKELILFVSVLIAIMVGALTLAIWGSSVKCKRQWEHSGMQSDYRVMQGCLIALPDGRKIPAKNYREL